MAQQTASENIKEGLDREVLAGLHRVIPAFGDKRGGEPIDAYLTSGEINKMLAQILSHLENQIKQMENPHTGRYAGEIVRDIIKGEELGYEDFRRHILAKLQ